MGSSQFLAFSELFRGADVGEFMALTFGEFAELRNHVGICDVFAVPSQQIVRFPKHCKRNVKRVAHLGVRNVTATEILPGKCDACRIDGQNR